MEKGKAMTPKNRANGYIMSNSLARTRDISCWEFSRVEERMEALSEGFMHTVSITIFVRHHVLSLVHDAYKPKTKIVVSCIPTMIP
jgi:hypothetical protein